MLVFIDESGDTGRKIGQGSSRFFCVSLVLFEDHKEAEDCDERIRLLKRELHLPEHFEFHFRNNSHRQRIALLKAVSPYSFFYFGIVLDKDPEKLWGEGFNHRESLYKYACSLVFENAKPYLREARVIIDKSGEKHFQASLKKYLRLKTKETQSVIQDVKPQHSHANNLLQLADYLAGIVNQVAMEKPRSEEYRRIVAHREMYVQRWPK